MVILNRTTCRLAEQNTCLLVEQEIDVRDEQEDQASRAATKCFPICVEQVDMSSR